MSTRCHTFSGSGFDPFFPLAADVRLEDIAHHLSMTCRYGGATPVFYAVSDHAVRVGRLVEEISGDPLWALHALHHDDGEAYVHDIRRPIKKALILRTPFASPFLSEEASGPVPFSMLEDLNMHVIHRALGIPSVGLADHEQQEELDAMIRDVDNAVLRAEMAGLFRDIRGQGVSSMIVAKTVFPSDCLSWEKAKEQFLSEHHRLMALVDAATRQ